MLMNTIRQVAFTSVGPIPQTSAMSAKLTNIGTYITRVQPLTKLQNMNLIPGPILVQTVENRADLGTKSS